MLCTFRKTISINHTCNRLFNTKTYNLKVQKSTNISYGKLPSCWMTSCAKYASVSNNLVLSHVNL